MECKDKGFIWILTLIWREFPRFFPPNPHPVAVFRQVTRNCLKINARFFV
jgi:hypothetical protein